MLGEAPGERTDKALRRLIMEAHCRVSSIRAVYRETMRQALAVWPPRARDAPQARKRIGTVVAPREFERRICSDDEKLGVELVEAARIVARGVVDGETWWWWDNRTGVSEGQLAWQTGTVPRELFPMMFAPWRGLARYNVHLQGMRERASRRAIAAIATQRTREKPGVAFELERDGEHGTVPRRARLVGGERVLDTEIVKVAYNLPVDPRHFEAAKGVNAQVRIGSERPAWRYRR
ncbi:MAG: hypothetical protein ACR2ND_15280 [Solirubrobacteraceae bacterium]